MAAQYGLRFDLAHVTATGDVLARDAPPDDHRARRFLAMAVREIRG